MKSKYILIYKIQNRIYKNQNSDSVKSSKMRDREIYIHFYHEIRELQRLQKIIYSIYIYIYI